MIARFHSARATAQRAYDLALASHRSVENQIEAGLKAGTLTQETGEPIYVASADALTVARNAKIEAERLYPTKDETRRREERLEANRRGWRD